MIAVLEALRPAFYISKIDATRGVLQTDVLSRARSPLPLPAAARARLALKLPF